MSGPHDHAPARGIQFYAALCAIACLLGASISLAQTPPPPARDAASDSVGASAGEFRVDESGNATYSMPIFAPPGTAGVAPSLSLTYNSGGGNGPLGKGWSISGQSAVTRCRRTREAGDFFDGSTHGDGNPKPVSYTKEDVFCLDGARLLLNSGEYGGDLSTYKLETDPFTLVSSHGGNNSATLAYSGPDFFVVRRKDGSSSHYGNRGDSRIASLRTNAVALWAQDYVEDSTGNYVTWHYTGAVNSQMPAGVQFLLSSVRYTGKRQLPGQTAPASLPYASIDFHYQVLFPGANQKTQEGWQGGERFINDQQLIGVEIRDQIDTGSPRTLRYLKPGYSRTLSGEGGERIRSMRECRENPDVSPQTPCYAPTEFTWTDTTDGVTPEVRHGFETADSFTDAGFTTGKVASRIGDVDGDGRMDLVWFREETSGCPAGSNSKLQVSFGERREVGGDSKLILTNPPQAIYCSKLSNTREIEAGWGLLDFDGDGQDDLMIADDNSVSGARWHVYRALGRPAPGGSVFDTSTDLINLTIPSVNDSEDQGQFGDFNADGLIDLMRPVGNTALAVHFLQRKADNSGFEFTAAQVLDIPPVSGCSGCNITITNTESGAGFGVAPDLNGDGRSDVVLRFLSGGNRPPDAPAGITYYGEDVLRAISAPEGSSNSQFYAFVMDARTPGTQGVKQYGSVLFSQTTDDPVDARQLQFGDFNGDGLPDILHQIILSEPVLIYAINRGNGFGISTTNAFSGEIRGIPPTLREHLTLADINGDGAAEVLFPSSSSHPCAGSSPGDRVFRYWSFTYQYALEGSFGPFNADSEEDAPCIAGNTVRAEDLSQWDYYFSDFDGDGGIDFIKLRDDTTQRIYTSRVGAESRHRPRDVIARVVNGHGARTDIRYQPLTNKAIYRRDADSRLKVIARGSPVSDMLAPIYVAAAVSSSAPVRDDVGAMATVAYRYQGAKVQAGGRGFLGFSRITTFDTDPVDGNWTLSEQFFRQDFPLIGAVFGTDKLVVPGDFTRGSAELDECAGNIEATGQNCFFNPAAAGGFDHPDFLNPAFGGKRAHLAATLWGCNDPTGGDACPFLPTASPTACIDSGVDIEAPFFGVAAGSSRAQVFEPHAINGTAPLGAAQPLFAYAARTLDLEIAWPDPAVTRHTCGLFEHDAFGNVIETSLSTYTDGTAQASKLLSRKHTLSLFLNDVANWRLGRLMSSQIDDTRAGATLTRTSDFDYEVDRAGYQSPTDTGLLKSERLQMGIASDQDLRTLYNLDDYGNRIASFSCSAQDASGAPLSDAQCQDVSRVPQRPLTATGPTTAVHRYSRQSFDGNGRYAVNSFMPFFSPQATNELSEGGAYSTVLERDEFGNATRQSDASGNETVARVGDLGRAYFAADATGAASTMTYAWCNGDNCPGGANFRQRTDVAGGASTFTYFDRLGREIVKVAQAFDAFEEGRNFSAVCTFYDAHSRAVEVSVPSFLESFFGNGDEPVFPGEPCVEGTIQPRSPSGFILSTRTTFDVLGRVIRVEAPDGSTATSEFDGLVTITTDARGSQTSSERNALGEVISMRQADAVTGEATGMEVTHEYDAQGNLRFVRRDAGLGEIVSETRYDVLGRPMEVIDPDRGTEQRFYNAAGEVIVGVDARGMRTEQDFDALGRVWRRRSGPGEAFMGGGGTGLPFGDGFEGTPLAPTGAGGNFAAIYTDTFQFDAQCAGPGGIRGLLAFEERRVGARSSCEAQGDPAAPPVPGEAGGLPSSAAYAQQLLQGDADTRIRHLYLYDLGRVITRFTQIDNSLTDAFEQVFTFDEFGRPATQTDARAIGSTAPDVETAIYTSRGYLYRRHYERAGVGAGGPVGVFEEIEEHDARAQVVRERIGPVSVVRETDDARGWLNSICAGINCGLQDLGYGYDDEGHLRVRTRNGNSLREDLIYDQLDRLTRVTRSGNATTPAVATADYDALGNLCTRTVTGGTLTYTYAGRDGCNGSGTAAIASPHAVSMTMLAGASTQYQYDLSGNLTLRDAAGTAEDRSTTTDARGQITQIVLGGGNQSTAFAYGPDGARYARIDAASGAMTRTLYVGRTERITRPAGPREIKRYLGAAIVTTCENAGGSEVACASGQTVEDRYVLGDHLGSLETLVSDTGTVIERTSFDAWGNRRDATTWSGTGTPLATTTHGFTGHEGIDALGLVHMNGRLFDPALARFIQADPMLDAGVQGMNRYSYVLNDPLSLTDPTGLYSAGHWFRQAISLAVIVASAFSAQGGASAVSASTLSTGAKLFLIGGAGATTAAVTSGNTRGSGWGAVSALAFYGIGTYFETATWAKAGDKIGVAKSGLNGGGYAAKVLAHGLTGGVLQSKQGGNFGSGFAAAGLTQAAGGYIDGLDASHPDFSPIRVLSAALVGGTASSITGGKFANGAVTGAFSRAFNDEAAHGCDEQCEIRGDYERDMRSPMRMGAMVAADAMSAIGDGLEEGYYWSAGGLGMRTMALTQEVRGLGTGYRSFTAFKRTIGRAGDGRAWHHIVEQNPANLERFGAYRIHNRGNLVALDNATHSKVSGFYSSVQPQITGSSSITVRQWVSGQSFSSQRAFGQQVLQSFRGSP